MCWINNLFGYLTENLFSLTDENFVLDLILYKILFRLGRNNNKYFSTSIQIFGFEFDAEFVLKNVETDF